MCFPFDARPPAPPADLLLPPIAGAAGSELLELRSADSTRFSAAFAEAPADNGGADVVILPDVRGLYVFYIELAERFAAAGHNAIAIDYFGRTAGLGPRDEQFEYAPHLGQLKPAAVQQDIAAALQALCERTGHSSAATVGFCLGGLLSFMAPLNPELQLSAAVGFYGILDASRFGIAGPLERAGEMGYPVLGLFGGEDHAIPVEQVEEFDAKLDETGVEHEIHVYPGAPHSFFDKRFDEYAEESTDAWRRMIGFLRRAT
jgi:carboxymethylenebutenolidase